MNQLTRKSTLSKIVIDVNRILLPDHRAAGLTLNEDDHNLYLEFEGKPVAVFTIHATITKIWEAANQFCQEQKSGVTFCERVK